MVAVRLLLCASLCVAESPREATLRAARLFDGLLAGYGEGVDAGLLPRAALDPHCGLRLADVLVDAEPGLRAVSDAAGPAREDFEPQLIVSGLSRIGSALRGFVTACHRCHLVAAADNLGLLANALLSVNASHVAGDNPPWPRILLGGADVGEPLARAGMALKDERHQQAGLTLALGLLLGSGEEDDERIRLWCSDSRPPVCVHR